MHCALSLKAQSGAIEALLGSLSHDLFSKFSLKTMEMAEQSVCGRAEGDGADIECDGDAVNEEEAEWEATNQRLLGLAVIGRMDCRRTLPMLAQTARAILGDFKAFKEQLAQFVAERGGTANGNALSGGAIVIPEAQRRRLEVMKERLFWAQQLLGYTLADDPYSETAAIPNLLIQRSEEEQNRCLVESILPLFEWMEFESGCIVDGGPMLEMTSPVLGAATMKMVCRWSSCYLMPNVAYYETLNVGVLRHFGDAKEGGAALRALEAVATKCSVNLMLWRGEPAVWTETVAMLRALTKHSSIRPLLLKSRAWNKGILEPYFDGKLNVDAFPNRIASELVSVIIQSVMGGDDGDDAQKMRFHKVADRIVNGLKVQILYF